MFEKMKHGQVSPEDAFRYLQKNKMLDPNSAFLNLTALDKAKDMDQFHHKYNEVLPLCCHVVPPSLPQGNCHPDHVTFHLAERKNDSFFL